MFGRAEILVILGLHFGIFVSSRSFEREMGRKIQMFTNFLLGYMNNPNKRSSIRDTFTYLSCPTLSDSKPPIAEILCVKSGRVIVVCGFLMK